MANRDPTMSSAVSHVEDSKSNYMIGYRKLTLFCMKYITSEKNKQRLKLNHRT